jgi:hypothetical protein
VRVVALVLVAACSSPQTCPSAEKLGGSDELARSSAKVIAERCRADRWSKQVTDCLARASGEDAQEACLHSLTPAQKASLDKAFEPIMGELDEAEKASTLAQLDRDIAALGLDELVARAPGCADFRSAIFEAKDVITKCPRVDALEAFGLHQVALAIVKKLRTITDPAQLATECATQAKARRESPPTCEATRF